MDLLTGSRFNLGQNSLVFVILALISFSRVALYYLSVPFPFIIIKQSYIYVSFTRWAVFSSLRTKSLFIYIGPRYFSQESQDDIDNKPLLWTLQKFSNNIYCILYSNITKITISIFYFWHIYFVIRVTYHFTNVCTSFYE